MAGIHKERNQQEIWAVMCTKQRWASVTCSHGFRSGKVCRGCGMICRLFPSVWCHSLCKLNSLFLTQQWAEIHYLLSPDKTGRKIRGGSCGVQEPRGASAHSLFLFMLTEELFNVNACRLISLSNSSAPVLCFICSSWNYFSFQLIVSQLCENNTPRCQRSQTERF